MLYKKLLLSSLMIVGLLSCEKEEIETTITEPITKSTAINHGEEFNVEIFLNERGNIFPGSGGLGYYGLRGFFAYNHDEEEYYYPDGYYQDHIGGHRFYELPAGSYTFSAYDGPFSGTGQTDIILDENTPLNENGDVEVILSFWAE